MTKAFGGVRETWQGFWFTPQPTSSLALFRIAFGVVATVWTVTQLPNLLAFYGTRGILPHAIEGAPGAWGVLELSDSPALVMGLFAVTLAASVAVTLGLFTRVAAVLLWVGIVSFQQRNLLVTNFGDGAVRMLALFCALSPAGAALSLDRLRKAPKQFWDFPSREPWALRLIQVQISIGYLSAVLHKVQNDLWIHGTAVSYALRIQDIHRIPTPAFVTSSPVLVNLLTYGTIATEFSLGVLVWNRRARPWVLLAGVGLHLGIDSSIIVGPFSYAMLAGYLAFIPPEQASRMILAVRDVASGRRRFPINVWPFSAIKPATTPMFTDTALPATGSADGAGLRLTAPLQEPTAPPPIRTITPTLPAAQHIRPASAVWSSYADTSAPSVEVCR